MTADDDDIRFATPTETLRAIAHGTFIGTLDGGSSSIYRYQDHEYIVHDDVRSRRERGPVDVTRQLHGRVGSGDALSPMRQYDDYA